MHSTRLYREQHTRIRTLCRPLLDPSRQDASPTFLRSTLAKLAGAVKLHLRDEDEQLYPRLLQTDDATVRATAEAFRVAMGGVADEFAGYYGRWIRVGAIDGDRSAFFTETDRILAALSTRMDREDGELYMLADCAASAHTRS